MPKPVILVLLSLRFFMFKGSFLPSVVVVVISGGSLGFFVNNFFFHVPDTHIFYVATHIFFPFFSNIRWCWVFFSSFFVMKWSIGLLFVFCLFLCFATTPYATYDLYVAFLCSVYEMNVCGFFYLAERVSRKMLILHSFMMITGSWRTRDGGRGGY